MKSTDIPKYMPVAFGVNGQRQNLQSSPVTGTSLASYDSGFPPITMVDKDAGGIPPQGKDFNQILYELSADAQWNQAGGIYPYNADFSTAIGGYPSGALVIGDDGISVYQSTKDDNTVAVGGDGWVKLASISDLSSTSSGKGLSLSVAEDGTNGQEFYEISDKFAGSYEDSTITITSVNSWITYNGERWYVNPNSTIPFTTTGVNATSWEADSSNFTPYVQRRNVYSLSELRGLKPNSKNEQVFVFGHSAGSNVGYGVFYYHQSDTTSVDNDCTVVVSTDGSRWKRMNADGEINTDWAGVLSTDESVTAQDDAFNNCISAATNSSGFVDRKIIVPQGKRVYLAEKHYLRGGSFTYNDAQGSATYRNTALGITGEFALGNGAGFFVVQAQAPEFDLRIDNAGVSLTSPVMPDYVNDDAVLQFEQLVWNPSIKIDANEYSGTLIKSLGSGSDSVTQTSAHWSDLTSQRHGMYLLTGNVHITANGCGRVWNIQNCPSGFGNFGNVWEQASSSDNLMNAVSDLAFPYYENTISYSSTSMGRCIYRSMGTCHFGKMLVGPHGNPAVHFEGSYQITIDKFFAVIGSSTYPTINFYGMDIVSSNVTFGKIYSQGHYGTVLRILKGSQVIAFGLNGDDLRQISILANDTATYAPLTTGSYTGTYPKLTVISGYVRRANSKSMLDADSLTPLPLFHIDTSVTAGGISIKNFTPREAYSGYTAESDMYYVKCLSSAPGLVDIDDTDLSQSSYPVYLTDPANLKEFRKISQIAGGCRIRYVNGTTSSEIGGGDVLSSSTTTPAIGTTYSNTADRPLVYSFRITVSSGGNITISKNGTEYIVQNYVGTQRVRINLNKGESFSISSPDTTLVSIGAASIYWSL